MGRRFRLGAILPVFVLVIFAFWRYTRYIRRVNQPQAGVRLSREQEERLNQWPDGTPITASKPQPAAEKRVRLGPVPPGVLSASRVAYTLSIFYPLPPQTSPEEELKKWLASQSAITRIENAGEAAPNATLFYSPRTPEQCPPPDARAVATYGQNLTANQVRFLPTAHSVSVLEFAGPRELVQPLLSASSKLAWHLASGNSGVIRDDSTGELFSAAEWKTRRMSAAEGDVPDVLSQIRLEHLEGFLTTFGMKKLGLPDLVVGNDWHPYQDDVRWLLVLAAQTILESPGIDDAGVLPVSVEKLRAGTLRDSLFAYLASGADGKADLAVFRVGRLNGDPENELIEIEVGAGKAGEFVTQRLFGAVDSWVRGKDAPAITKAAARVQARMATAIKHIYLKGVPAGERLYVRTTDRSVPGSFTLWLRITAWRDGVLTGSPVEGPDDIRINPNVTWSCEEKQILDYFRVLPDGTSEGNENKELLDRIR